MDRFLQLDTQFHLCVARATTVVSLMRSLLRRLEIARDLALHDPPIPSWVVDSRPLAERSHAKNRSAPLG